jgi:hypothetical protein
MDAKQGNCPKRLPLKYNSVLEKDHLPARKNQTLIK